MNKNNVMDWVKKEWLPLILWVLNFGCVTVGTIIAMTNPEVQQVILQNIHF